MRSENDGHAVEHFVDLGDDVDTVDHERPLARHAQGDVQDRPVLRRVDPVAAEHRLRALREARFLGELEKEAQRLVGDAVLRVVEVDADALGGQALAAGCVLGEQVAEMHVRGSARSDARARARPDAPEAAARGQGSHGLLHPPWSRTSSSADAGPHVPGS